MYARSRRVSTCCAHLSNTKGPQHRPPDLVCARSRGHVHYLCFETWEWRCHGASNDSLYSPRPQSAHGLHLGKKLWIERAKLSDAHVQAAGHKREEALVRTQAHPLVLAPLSLVSPSSWDPSLFLPHRIYHGIYLSNLLLPTSWDP